MKVGCSHYAFGGAGSLHWQTSGDKRENFSFDNAKRLNLAENVYISEKYLDDSA